MRAASIRLRLVVGSSIAAGLLVAVALGVARLEIADQLHASAAELARTDLVSYAADLRNHGGETPDPAAEGQLILITDPSGAVSIDTLPHDVRPFVLSDSGAADEFRFADDEGRSYVIARETVQLADGTWSLWAARDVSSSTAALAGIDAVFVITGISLLGVMALASWVLVRRALGAVETLRQRAGDLSGQELLPVSSRGDELDVLATTLNGFVRSVRESAERERRMVSDAAHELRTPLAGLRAELELLQREQDQRTIREGLVRAGDSAERLGALATNLLELSRLDEAPTSLESSTGAAIGNEILGAVDRARLLAASPEVEVVDDLRLSAPERRYGIAPLGVARVLDNLLANALRESGESGFITASAVDDDEGLLITVQDTAGGMDAEFLPRAFDRFSRASSARSDGGAGLGLALVAALAHSAGGTATAENRDGGLAVEVRFPKM
jgi:two-component system, OmpR family, sensor kinase